METLRNIFDWLINNPSELLWITLPALVVFIFALVKILQIFSIRRADSNTIIKLVDYQTKAVANNIPARERMTTYLQILQQEKNVIKFILYKYMLSHNDFTNIMGHYSYTQYIKVKQALPEHRTRSKLVTWLIAPFVVLFILFGLAVSLAHYTTLFTDFGTSNITRSLIIPAIIIAFFIASIIIILLYNMSVQKYKAALMEELQATADAFFAPIKLSEFAVIAIKTLNIHEHDKNDIKKLIIAEGQNFRQGFCDKADGVIVCEEELVQTQKKHSALKTITITATDLPTEQTPLVPVTPAPLVVVEPAPLVIVEHEPAAVVEVVSINETLEIEPEPQNIDEIFTKFEEQGATTAVAPLLQFPAESTTNDKEPVPPKKVKEPSPTKEIEPESIVKAHPVFIAKPISYIPPKHNPWMVTNKKQIKQVESTTTPPPTFNAKPMTYTPPMHNPWSKQPQNKPVTATLKPTTVEPKQKPNTPKPVDQVPDKIIRTRTVEPKPLDSPLFIDENPIVPIVPKSKKNANPAPLKTAPAKSKDPAKPVEEKPRVQRIKARTTEVN